MKIRVPVIVRGSISAAGQLRILNFITMSGLVKYITFSLLLFFIAGCSGAVINSYMREEVPLDFVKKIAVMPLENNTDQKHVHKLARDVIGTQVLAEDFFDVVDPGVVDDVLHEEAVKPGEPLSRMLLQRLGKRLDIQAVIMGSVDIADNRRIGSVTVPEISITMRLVETGSGTVLWRASGQNDGDSIVGRLFGISPPSFYEVTLELVRELLATVPASVEPVIESEEPGSS